MRDTGKTLLQTFIAIGLFAPCVAMSQDMPPGVEFASKDKSGAKGPEEHVPPEELRVDKAKPIPPAPGTKDPAVDDFRFPTVPEAEQPWWDTDPEYPDGTPDDSDPPEVFTGVSFSTGGVVEYDESRDSDRVYLITPVELSIDVTDRVSVFIGAEGHGYEWIEYEERNAAGRFHEDHSAFAPDMWTGISFSAYGGSKSRPWLPTVTLSAKVAMIVGRRAWRGDSTVIPSVGASFGWTLPSEVSLSMGVGFTYKRDETNSRFTQTSLSMSVSRSLDPIADWITVCVGAGITGPHTDRSQVSASTDVSVGFDLTDNVSFKVGVTRGIVHKTDADWGGSAGLTVSF